MMLLIQEAVVKLNSEPLPVYIKEDLLIDIIIVIIALLMLSGLIIHLINNN